MTAGRGEEQRSGLVVRTRSPEPFRALQRDLMTAVAEPDARIVRLLGIHNYLVFSTVARGERAAGRIILRRDKLEAAVESLSQVGVACVRSEMDFVADRESLPATQHEGHLVPAGSEQHADGIVYLGITAAVARGAALAESRSDHVVLGRLFGYPSCCTRSFAARNADKADRTWWTVPSAGPHFRELNPVVPHLFGLNLLFHFPCSATCEHSRRLWDHRVSFLEALAPSARYLRSVGAGIAFYGDRCEIALATSYRPLGGHRYDLREVVCRAPEAMPWRGWQGRPVEVELLDGHRFAVGGQKFGSEEQVAALFA